MDDAEYAQWQADQTAAADAPAPQPRPPNALEIAHALVNAVTGAADFATAQTNLEQVAATLPTPEGEPPI